ncbi:hypothetical protein JCM21714_2118 [Gracilibacillus boraciitolerans JCM 21714]|uniref:Uncharacterized protein n=1 Tax=Gracilibacillus boraciitolerans JCM 21714 TaxID=1298598 RepID=W4VIV7_9BACI|nr:hypothetical protein [Gracilibacillus boraciitolerans]GAE93081.1 hypothetical protein JCM21714_2118 [Gracilibacillus boraciitolerans JCM 21714]
MGEKTGFIAVLLVFAIGLLPLCINTYVNHVYSTKLLSTSAEVQQLVSAEGGITPRVQEVVTKLESQGATIVFTDGNGNTVSGTVPVGEEIIMDYEYEDFQTRNSTVILRR